MLRFANAGHFPLIAASVAADLSALSFVASAQTFATSAAMAIIAVYFARLGFLSERVRSWSNMVWIGGVLTICLFPSLFPDLTPQLLDYAITSWSNEDWPAPFDAIYGKGGLN
ncbi:MAG: hypothetical protein N2444_07710, partial [Methylocystis sp.]|nr:hypothetical protein [Methylocystis sp.]